MTSVLVKGAKARRYGGRWYRPGDLVHDMDELTAVQWVRSCWAEFVPTRSRTTPTAPTSNSRQADVGALPLYIVIPTYRRETLLVETVVSVHASLAAAATDGRIIVVDDAGTVDAEALGPDVTLLRTPPRERRQDRPDGPNIARRLGNSHVPDDAIIIEIDDHDLMPVQAIRAIVDAFADEELQVAWGNADMLSEDGEHVTETWRKPPYTPGQLRRDRCYSAGVRAYRKAAYDAVGGYREDEVPAGDYALLLRMELWLGDDGLMRIDETLCQIRRDPSGISNRWGPEQRANAERFNRLAQAGQLDLPTQPRRRATTMAGPLPPGISVVMPHYGPPTYIHQTLETLCSATAPESVEIIVVDNASFDQCEEVYRLFSDRIRVLRAEHNLGWVGGVNKGLAEATGGYVLVTNDDLMFPSDFGERLTQMHDRMAADPEIASISPCRFDGGSDSTLQTQCKRFGRIPEELAQPHELCTQEQVDEQNVRLRDGVPDRFVTVGGDVVLFSVFCRADVLCRIGGLCEIYGLGYTDDVDYTRRSQELGFRHEVDLHTFAYHEMSKTFRNGTLIPGFNCYHQTNRRLYEALWGSSEPTVMPVLFTTWNRLAYTEQSLPALLDSGDDLFILAIDNASTDGTQGYLREQEKAHPDKLRVILNEENRGVAGAMNQFCRMLRGRGGRIPFPVVGKVDNDSIVSPGWADRLRSLLREHTLDVVQCAHPLFGDDKGDGEGPVRTEHRDGKRIVNVGGSGVLIRTDKLQHDAIPEIYHVRGWTTFQRTRDMLCGVALDEWLTLLDRDDTGEANADYPDYTQTVWSDRAGGEQKIVAGLRVHNDADRYLPEVLTHLSMLADEIVVLDDASSDDTPGVCNSCAKVRYHQNERNIHVSGEGQNRTRLYQLCAEREPDWIIWLDSDEMFEPCMTRQLYHLIADPDAIAYTFEFLHFWDGFDRYRIDGLWRGYRNVRLFRYCPEIVWELPDGVDHCGAVPPEIKAQALHADNYVLHLGYARRRDQFEKIIRHCTLDTEGRGGGIAHYMSILADRPELRHWPKGLPVPIKDKPIFGFSWSWDQDGDRRVTL